MTWISSSTIFLGRSTTTTLRSTHLRSSNLLTRCMSSSSSSTTPDKSHLITPYPASAFPSGYLVSSTHSGIKSKSPSTPDLGVLISTSPNPCIAAATFTRNVFKAAPVQVSNEVIKQRGGRVRGFVVSSGCANAVTGQKGLEDAWKMSRTVDDHAPRVSVGEGEDAGTLVMSTGVIGQHLPIDKITTSIPHLLSSLSSTPEAWLGLAKSFMTTDTFPKLRTREFKLNDQTIKLVGIDKGAGMIHPNMGPPHGTLLGVIATDAKVERGALQSALGWAVDRSFNSITVDGDMSTNDTVLCLANGAAGVNEGEGEGEGSGGMREISEEGTPEEYEVFKRELTGFAEELAQLVVRDGEGATKFVTIRVENAPTYEVARKVASSIATSSLVKTAMYGEDANWGRILCAVGYTDVPEGTISPTSVSVSFAPPTSSSNPTPLRLLTNGEPEPKIDESRASEILAQGDLEVLVDLGVEGGEKANYWTCDFSHEYVTINGHYRT